jgi:hypothetical protein
LLKEGSWSGFEKVVEVEGAGVVQEVSERRGGGKGFWGGCAVFGLGVVGLLV